MTFWGSIDIGTICRTIASIHRSALGDVKRKLSKKFMVEYHEEMSANADFNGLCDRLEFLSMGEKTLNFIDFLDNNFLLFSMAEWEEHAEIFGISWKIVAKISTMITKMNNFQAPKPKRKPVQPCFDLFKVA